MRTALCRILASACALAAIVPATAAASATPRIASVAPLQLRTGERLTIRGSGFVAGARRTTVVFKVAGAPAVAAKADSATRTRLVVRVPGKLGSYLGRGVATRVRLRVVARRASKRYTSVAASPLVAADAPAPAAAVAPVTATPAVAPRPAAASAPKSTGTKPAAAAPVKASVPTAVAPATACSDGTGLSWPLDLASGTYANWPETHLSGDSAILDAADARVPTGAPASKVAMLVAADDPLGGNDARSAIQQKFSVKPEWWDASHQHGTPGTAGYYIDPYPAELLGRDGVDGMERFVRESFAVPVGSNLPAGTIVSDWHARWGVNIVLRTAADGTGAWELVVRGGRFEYAPVDPATGKPTYPAWANKTTSPYWSPYNVPGVGAFAQEYQRIFKAIAPVTPGQWVTLTWHIAYSADASAGRVELWWNGRLVHAAAEPTLYRLVGSPQPAANADGVKPVYHQLQDYQPGAPATDPPQRIFVAPDRMATYPLEGC
jgi:Polysaccharide lyase